MRQKMRKGSGEEREEEGGGRARTEEAIIR
jgi:hypothetical protein